MKKVLFTFCSLFAIVGFLSAQTDSVEKKTVQSMILFRLGKSNVDPTFQDNQAHLAQFIGELNRIEADSDYVVSRIVVTGTASPDGALERNLELAGQRADSLAWYIVNHTGISRHRIETVNAGENWTGLRAMIEASDEVPDKAAMLGFLDRYASDQVRLKRAMQYYNGSRAWLWMYEHFFPTLRTGSGGAQGTERLSALSQGNWKRMREIVLSSQMDPQTRGKVLEVLDRETDAKMRMERLRLLCPAQTYALLQQETLSGLVNEPSLLSKDNWAALRDQIANSQMTFRNEVLGIIDSVPLLEDREAKLRELHQGEPYGYIKDHIFPELLESQRTTHTQTLAGTGEATTLSAENWSRLQHMIAASDMPGKDQVLELIGQENDMELRGRRLREINGGEAYRYIQDVFFPELLYGLSPAATKNWEKLSEAVKQSDMPQAEKARILDIMSSTAPGPEREEALRALDQGETWKKISTILLPKLLLDMEPGEMSGSGMSFYYEPSPAAKARAAALQQEEQERRLAEERRKQQVQYSLREVQQARERAEQQAELQRQREARQQARKLHPLLAVKTDAVFWAGVMPGFERGTYTPNLAAELFFARRWSLQLGGSYAYWDAILGDYGVFATSALDLELRSWLGTKDLFRGFFMGLYGTYGDYDVQDGSAPKGQTGTFFGAGAGVGWAQPISRHWSFEVQVRAGYRSVSNEFYDIDTQTRMPHYYLDCKQSKGEFVPQVRLQLVYRFGKPKE